MFIYYIPPLLAFKYIDLHNFEEGVEFWMVDMVAVLFQDCFENCHCCSLKRKVARNRQVYLPLAHVQLRFLTLSGQDVFSSCSHQLT